MPIIGSHTLRNSNGAYFSLLVLWWNYIALNSIKECTITTHKLHPIISSCLKISHSLFLGKTQPNHNRWTMFMSYNPFGCWDFKEMVPYPQANIIYFFFNLRIERYSKITKAMLSPLSESTPIGDSRIPTIMLHKKGGPGVGTWGLVGAMRQCPGRTGI